MSNNITTLTTLLTKLTDKAYTLGVNRYLKVTVKDGDTTVKIYEDLTYKAVTFTVLRWAQLVKIIDQIDEALQQVAAKQYVRFCYHIGGKVHASVTTGYPCVDLRVFYNQAQHGPRPSYEGISLRLKEWATLKELLPQLRIDFPALASTQTCTDAPDHANLLGAVWCSECSPYTFALM